MHSTENADEGREPTTGAGTRQHYLHSDHDLYHVEHIGPERALLEDCRTGTLLDVPIGHLRDLEPVTPADAVGLPGLDKNLAA